MPAAGVFAGDGTGVAGDGTGAPGAGGFDSGGAPTVSFLSSESTEGFSSASAIPTREGVTKRGKAAAVLGAQDGGSSEDGSVPAAGDGAPGAGGFDSGGAPSAIAIAASTVAAISFVSAMPTR